MIGKNEKAGMSIRPYQESDLSRLEQLDMFTVLQIKYHGGVKSDNVFCAVENNSIIGAGLLTVFKDGKVEFYTHTDDPALKEKLTECLIHRFHELQNENHKMFLRTCRLADKIADVQFLVNRGFYVDNTILWLKRDLSFDIEHFSIPEEIKIETYVFNGETMPKYLKAAEESGLLPIKDMSDSWFRTGAPGFTCFTAICDNEVVGSVTIFNTSEECGATEYIFVVPDYRRKNVARELIATALTELKKRGKKEASLSVFGSNRLAMNLYLSMGYTLTGTILELNHS